MKDLISRLVKEEEGAAIIEYVLLVALIAVVAVAAITTLGKNVSGKYDEVSTTIPGG